MDPERCWLWLARVLGPAAENAGDLLAVYGDAETILNARFAEDFSAFLTPPQLDRLQSLDPADCDRELAACHRLGVQLLYPGHPDYPAAFLAIPDLPVLLYTTGEPGLLTDRILVGMVGSRRPSPYGVEAAARLGGEMARGGAVLVSGLADGLDSQAHAAALDAGELTVGVLGCAIDKTYPAANRVLRGRIERQGAVFSEYGPGAQTFAASFLQRNRLIAALSDALVVVEARHKSGTMSTVRHAERYGRPVYAVPGSIFSSLSEGTNALLAENRARAVCRGADVLEPLGLTAPAAAKSRRAPLPAGDAGRVLALLGPTPKGFEQLKQESTLSAGALLAALTQLELAGRIDALAGRRYQRRG